MLRWRMRFTTSLTRAVTDKITEAGDGVDALLINIRKDGNHSEVGVEAGNNGLFHRDHTSEGVDCCWLVLPQRCLMQFQCFITEKAIVNG